MDASVMSGYSVDRRGIYVAGQQLPLWKSDPLSRPLAFRTDGFFDLGSLDAHVAAQFPDGLSRHGWEYMTGDVGHRVGNDHVEYVRTLMMIELVCELVRQAHFPKLPSRLQSYFAFETLAEARVFRATQPGQTTPEMKIFKLRSDRAIRVDQQWLLLGYTIASSPLMASKYWSGAASAAPKWEIVLGPPATAEALVP